MAENKNAKTPADDGQPVAWMMVNKVIGPPSLHWKPQEDWHITWECKPLYTAPPKKQWVGLTLKEILINRHLIDWTSEWSYLEFAREIEQALKEKNT